MWFESCGVPDNSLRWLNIILPNELKNWVIDDTKYELARCFVESLRIDSWSEILTGYIKDVLTHLSVRYWDKMFPLKDETIERIIQWVLNILKEQNPDVYKSLKNNPDERYITINWKKIDFSFLLLTDVSVWINKSDIVTNWNDIPNWWFQRETNNGITLSEYIEHNWLPDSLTSPLSQIFWQELKAQEVSQVWLLIRYVLEAESYGWYNLPHKPWFPGSWWYFEYQKNDGEYWWEEYDFASKTFRQISWGSGVVEVKNITWDDKRWIRKVWHDSSYDMALRRIPESILDLYPQLRQEFDNIWNPDKQDMSKLSAELQIIVLLSDLFWDKRWPELFNRILQWDKYAISELYATIHHTDLSNPNTNSLKHRLDFVILWISKRPHARPSGLNWYDIASNE